MLAEICFEAASGRQLLLADLTVEDFDRYMVDVNEVAQVFRRAIENPPHGLEPGQVLGALTSVGTQKIMKLAGNPRALEALIVHRHELISVPRPLSLGDLRAFVIKVLDRTKVRPGPENCVEFAEVVLRGLFPGGIRPSTSQDDRHIASDRAEHRLAYGGTSTHVASMDDVVGPLGQAPTGSVAVLLEQSDNAIGHVSLYVNLGTDKETGLPSIAHIDPDPQASAPVAMYQEPLTPETVRKSPTPEAVAGHRPIWAGKGTRMIIIDGTRRTIDGTGLAIDTASLLLPPQSAHPAQAHIAAPTSTDYGRIGFEVEENLRFLTNRDGSPIRSKAEIATHRLGYTITTDKTSVYQVGGRTFSTLGEARQFDNHGKVTRELKTIVEIVGPPYSALPGEERTHRALESGIQEVAAIRRQLAQRPHEQVPIASLLSKADGWQLKSAADQILISPSISGRNHPGNYIQFTTGVNIGGVTKLIAWAQDRISQKAPQMLYSALLARDFSADIAKKFATRTTRRTVESEEVAFLLPVVPGLLQIDAYAWLMFSHASAHPLQMRFDPAAITKSFLPVALRNPFRALHASLDGHVKSFLAAEKDYIIERFRVRLLEAIDFFQKMKGMDPAISSQDVMNEVAYSKYTHAQYVTSMILGGQVSQWDMVGMYDNDYKSLDQSNGMPLALFELRGISRMGQNEFEKVTRELGGISRQAHSMALRGQILDHSQTPTTANRVLSHPSVRAMGRLFPYLSRLQTYEDDGEYMPLLSFSDHLTIAEGYAEHARTGQPLAPEIHDRLLRVRTSLERALGAASKVPERHRHSYREAFDALRRLIPERRHASQKVRVAVAQTDDAMRAGLQQALADARTAQDPDLARITRLEAHLQEWSPQEVQPDARNQFTAQAASDAAAVTPARKQPEAVSGRQHAEKAPPSAVSGHAAVDAEEPRRGEKNAHVQDEHSHEGKEESAHTATSTGDAGSAATNPPPAYLHTPRLVQATVPSVSGIGHLLADGHRDEDEPALQSVVRPLTMDGLEAAALHLRKDVVGSGFENCVQLTQVMLRHLFPEGIRSTGASDDVPLGLNRVEDLLVPGGIWSPLTSSDQVIQALDAAGRDSVAVLLEQREDKGHVRLHVHLGSDPQTRDLKTALVDLQATPPVQLHSEIWDPKTEQRAIRAGRGTRMIVIDATGQAVSSLASYGQVASSSTSQALIDAPTGHDYGRLGLEVERGDQPITTSDRSTLDYGTTLARNVVNGIKLTVDKSPVFQVDGRTFLSQEQARRESGGKAPQVASITIIEVVTPPYAILPGENASENLEQGLAKYARVRQLLHAPTESRSTARLSDLLREEKGWKLEPAGRKVLVHPAIGGGHYPQYTQFTVGVNIGGASLVIAMAQDRNVYPHLEIPLEKARHFAAGVATDFARFQLGRQDVTARDLPFLFSIVPGLRQVEAYAWLMFSHGIANPIRARFFPTFITKNLLPVALRNPFHVLRDSLTSQARDFLKKQETQIISRFRSELIDAVTRIAQERRLSPPSVSDIMEETSSRGVIIRNYLSSMIRGTAVSQHDAVALDDYDELDSSNGQLPLALLELRSLAPGMTDAQMGSTSMSLHSIANVAHNAALSVPVPAQPSDFAWVSHFAGVVVESPLAQNVKMLLPELSLLRVVSQGGRHEPLFSRLDVLIISESITAHVALGKELRPEVRERFQRARQKLVEAMAATPPHAEAYPRLSSGQRSIETLLRQMDSMDVPRRHPRAPESPGTVVLSEGREPVSFGTGAGPVAGWDGARAGAVPRRVAREWMDPVSQPEGIGGAHAPRYAVVSDFDVRTFAVGGATFSDLTVRVELTGREGVLSGEMDALWERALAGVEEVFNARGLLLPDGSVLHVTLERVTAGQDPHLQASVVAAGSVMDQQHWTVNASALALAHEVGHQLLLKDEYDDATAPQRVVSDGSIMGNFHKPAPEGMSQAGVRQRHLQLIQSQIETAQDLESFARSRRLAAQRPGKAVVGAAPQAKNKGKAGDLATAPAPDGYDHDNPNNPSNVLTIEHLERAAGVSGSIKALAKERAALLAAAKTERPAAAGRTLDELLQKTGREILLGLQRQPAEAGSLDLYRAMSAEEAQNVLEYWNGPEKIRALQYVATGSGTAKEFKSNYTGLTVGAHFGGRSQVEMYHSSQGRSYLAMLKFTLKPGAHKILFTPQIMALGPGYASELIRKAGGDYKAASQHKGSLPGYIGLKAEQHGAFSLAIAQGSSLGSARVVGPSQLLFQLLVESISVVSNKSDTPLPGEPSLAGDKPVPSASPVAVGPRAPRADQAPSTVRTSLGASRDALAADPLRTEPPAHGISDITRPSDGEPAVLPRGTQHDSPAAHSQEHTAPAPRLAATPTPIEPRATGQDGVALGALWRGPQDQEALLTVQQVITGELEIGDFIPHDLRNEFDTLTNMRPADTTQQEHLELATPFQARLVDAAHTVRLHLAEEGRGTLNTRFVYTISPTVDTFENDVLFVQRLVDTFELGIAIDTGNGNRINICP
ncbi:hypothetical protein ACFZBE_39405 [Streptomyces sp. NPDC008061]|uniref:hypothetical protein n=1 Tax=Streptomyces sp. NPDC008061 TaxID=3364805 RepID=UPI0036E3A5D4